MSGPIGRGASIMRIGASATLQFALLPGCAVPATSGSSPTAAPVDAPASPAVDSPGISATTQPAVYAAWDRYDVEADSPSELSGIVRFGSSLVAVGSVGSCCGPSDIRGASWISAEGEQWELVPEQESLTGATLREVATDGQTLLALGAVWPESPTGPHIVGERALFRSEDGRTWERLPDAPELTRLAGVSSRFVGIENGDETVIAWLSDDGGRTWHNRQLPGELGTHDERFAITDLVNGRDRKLVAIGSVVPASAMLEPPSGTSWTSSDGRETWARSDESVPGIELRHGASIGGRFFALSGSAAALSTWVYASDDGRSWTGNEVVRHTSLDIAAFSWLGADGDVLFLLTHELNPDGHLVATMRTSTNGTDWAIVPDQPGLDGTNVFLSDVVQAANGVIAVGAYAPRLGAGSRPAAWRSTR